MPKTRGEASRSATACVGLRVVQALGHVLRIVPLRILLVQRQQPGIGAKLTVMSLDNDRQLWDKIEGNCISKSSPPSVASCVSIKVFVIPTVMPHGGPSREGSS